MFLRLYLIALLVVTVTSEINCDRYDSCFGEPYNCNPNNDCISLIHFDDNDDLHFYVRNFTEIRGYAAFPVERYPDETIDYIFCVPNQNEQFRARADIDGTILTIDEKYEVPATPIAKNYFRCDINSSDLPKGFQQKKMFTVSKGSLENMISITNGVDLYNLNQEMDFEDDSNEDVYVTASLYYLGTPVDNDERWLRRSVRSVPVSNSGIDEFAKDDKSETTKNVNQASNKTMNSSDDEEFHSAIKTTNQTRDSNTAHSEITSHNGHRNLNNQKPEKINLAMESLLVLMLKYIF